MNKGKVQPVINIIQNGSWTQENSTLKTQSGRCTSSGRNVVVAICVVVTWASATTINSWTDVTGLPISRTTALSSPWAHAVT
jgi:hypothetical protein